VVKPPNSKRLSLSTQNKFARKRPYPRKMMGERLEKTIPQREKAPEKRLRKKAIRGRLEKAIPQKNDGGKAGKGHPHKGEGWKSHAQERG
jgi:hypothetical protein